MAVLLRASFHGACDWCREPIFPGEKVYFPEIGKPRIMVCAVCVEEEGL